MTTQTTNTANTMTNSFEDVFGFVIDIMYDDYSDSKVINNRIVLEVNGVRKSTTVKRAIVAVRKAMEAAFETTEPNEMIEAFAMIRRLATVVSNLPNRVKTEDEVEGLMKLFSKQLASHLATKAANVKLVAEVEQSKKVKGAKVGFIQTKAASKAVKNDSVFTASAEQPKVHTKSLAEMRKIAQANKGVKLVEPQLTEVKKEVVPTISNEKLNNFLNPKAKPVTKTAKTVTKQVTPKSVDPVTKLGKEPTKAATPAPKKAPVKKVQPNKTSMTDNNFIPDANGDIVAFGTKLNIGWGNAV